MARYRGPRVKVCRALGVALPGLTNKKINKQYPPGQHGASRRGKPSDYKIRLQEKQKLRFHYGVMEKQFKGYMTEAARRKGPTGENDLCWNLDWIIWFGAWVCSNDSSHRQMVVHGHININGRKVDRPSYQVRVGSTIQIREEVVKLIGFVPD